MDLSTERERDPLSGEFVTDRPGVRNRSSKAVELRDDERVAVADSCGGTVALIDRMARPADDVWAVRSDRCGQFVERYRDA
jgi:hypothetical protein